MKNYSTFNEPVFISESQMVMKTESNRGRIEEFSITSKTIYQAQPPYNLLYDYYSATAGGSKLSVTTTRQNESMIIIRSDGVNEEEAVSF